MCSPGKLAYFGHLFHQRDLKEIVFLSIKILKWPRWVNRGNALHNEKQIFFHLPQTTQKPTLLDSKAANKHIGE